MYYNNNKKIPKILSNYIEYLKNIKNYSEKTIKNYSSSLMQFLYFIKDYSNYDLNVYDFNIFILISVKESDIIAFLVYLNYTKENSPYTRQRKLDAIKSFYSFVYKKYKITHQKKNPAENISNIKKVERLPKYLTLEQAKQLRTVFTKENCRNPIKYNCIINLLLSSGIRASELLNIKIGDINLDANKVLVFGKNKKERYAYFSDYCKQHISCYINSQNSLNLNLNANTYLFTNKAGNKISIFTLEKIVKKAYRLIGIEEKSFSIHTLRHTAATLTYQYVTKDISIIKELLGHSSICSTQIYTHVINENVKEAVNKNPLSNYVGKGGE